MAPPRSGMPRGRTPWLIGAVVGTGALFIGLKWKAVLARSEAAKKSGTKEINYSVAPNRSGGGV
ncbi:uncharacterized protein LY89DRAFT_743306 [Mollisia scopiformis]|uniref:Uncharacterized protein n=1 Tax=Mollisia scopiformis TaxID=149040 RepID=A0A132B3J7_MOLSC|nr:uncharacterized protein LY89DRAFT_743306 [Mollisia scopiformis]KUJ06975.1 hypothetical protein LY89DRAFT_743306 [Mollisia scopiformis]